MNEERTLTIRSEGMARGQDVKIKEIPMNKIKIGRNSRLSVSKEDLSGLMQSINSTGLLEPIGVVESGNGYEIAYGNRRYMAFSKLGLHSIPAVIHKRKNDNDVDVMNLAENVQRRNISLAEIGRYASILEGEGLGQKELAVRLGCTLNYVQSCLAAYNDVPKAYRDDLEVQTSSAKKRTPGKISITDAQSILNAQKSQALKREDVLVLFKAAKSDDRWNKDNIHSYVSAIKKGSKDPIGDVKAVKTLTFRFIMDEAAYDKLMDKYVNDGPFNSFTSLVKSVLRGQTAAMINVVE